MEWEDAKQIKGIKRKKMKEERGNDKNEVHFGLFYDALGI
jgi:hypothetical protein